METTKHFHVLCLKFVIKSCAVFAFVMKLLLRINSVDFEILKIIVATLTFFAIFKIQLNFKYQISCT
jgi:hypothetical protein